MSVNSIRERQVEAMKARIFNIMQYEKHPETGEVLLTEDRIKVALAHRTIKQWAYVLHDKDVYSEDDELADATHVAGTPKPPHWHIVMNCNNAMEIQTIAKWFGIADNFVDIPKGNGAGKFLDCVEYLTHESYKQQELGKHRYADEEVHASEGFDWRAKLDKRNENKVKYGRDLSEEDQVLYDVLYNGMTLHEVEKYDPLIYMDNVDKLLKFRMDYIRRMPPPKQRINYYIYGKGGIGKDLMSRSLARALFPDIEEDEDIFFVVGAGNVTFEGYDGQPVIIWSDRRSLQLVKTLGGKENFFNVFDTHPSRQRQNVKNSSISLCNVVNIINGQEDYIEFLDNIVRIKDEDGNWVIGEDKGQSYRRFPFIIPLHDEYFDLMVNKGYFSGNRSLFAEYEAYNHTRASMAKIALQCGGENGLQRLMSSKILEPVTAKHKEALELENKEVDEEAAWKWFHEQGYGRDQFEWEAEQREKRQLEEKARQAEQMTLDMYETDGNGNIVFHEDEDGNSLPVRKTSTLPKEDTFILVDDDEELPFN